ncbi:MAG: S-layer homology domain-containing protein [Actinobacteria bacterium]|nr:S-layer homology domain-containing protein [Actinomycetota bacterium]
MRMNTTYYLKGYRRLLAVLMILSLLLSIALVGTASATTQSVTPMVEGGYLYSFAIKSDGTVRAWGRNTYGQLGDGTTTDRHTPVQVQGLSGVISVAATVYTSLVLKSDSTVWAWGDNVCGELGDGTTTNRLAPVKADIILSAGSGGSPAPGSTFSDIPADAWYKIYVEVLVAKGVISGYPDGTFKPLNSITRAEFSKMIILAMGESPSTSTVTSFTDVTSSYWAHGYIERAKELGIIDGYPDSIFKPTANVSRQEIAKMVVLAAKLSPPISYRADFTDVPSTLWSWSYILAAKDAGIISGYPDQTFKPINPATRAEACKMVQALVK